MELIKQLKIDAKALEGEIEKSSTKYHYYGAWIAVVFDPIFGITDFLNLPNHWLEIFYLRLGVSVLTLLGIFLYRKYKFSSRYIVFVPFLLISLQNAYTYSLIEVSEFTGHTLNYIALLIGAGMFILWRWYFTVAVIGISTVANVIFFNMNHALSLEDALINGGLLLIVVAIFTILIIQTRYRLIIANIKARMALQASYAELAVQKQIIEEKNKDITSSIKYAERIQRAMLPDKQKMSPYFARFFVLFMPRDIVSGDFYWMGDKNGLLIIAAVDCTGHGVPGAFMSMIGDALLNQIVFDIGITDPDQILALLDQGVKKALHQEQNKNRDGMDAAICVIDYENNQLHYAGAHNPLVLINKNAQIVQLKADRLSIGGPEVEKKFTKQSVSLADVEMVYLFSDGFQDQFGGQQGRKFMSKRFKELLAEIHGLDGNDQQEILRQKITEWMREGKQKQIDDILVMGFAPAF